MLTTPVSEAASKLHCRDRSNTHAMVNRMDDDDTRNFFITRYSQSSKAPNIHKLLLPVALIVYWEKHLPCMHDRG